MPAGAGAHEEGPSARRRRPCGLYSRRPYRDSLAFSREKEEKRRKEDPFVVLVGGKHGSYEGIATHVPDGVHIIHVATLDEAVRAARDLDDPVTRDYGSTTLAPLVVGPLNAVQLLPRRRGYSPANASHRAGSPSARLAIQPEVCGRTCCRGTPRSLKETEEFQASESGLWALTATTMH